MHEKDNMQCMLFNSRSSQRRLDRAVHLAGVVHGDGRPWRIGRAKYTHFGRPAVQRDQSARKGMVIESRLSFMEPEE